MPLHLSLRVLAATAGGWLCVLGWVALGTAAGHVLLGMDFHDAERLSLMLGLLLYLGLMLWALSARSLPRVWAALAGGGALMLAAAWLLQRAVT